MFTRSKYQTADMIEQHKLLDRIADWIDRGTIKGILSETLQPINVGKPQEGPCQVGVGHDDWKACTEGLVKVGMAYRSHQ